MIYLRGTISIYIREVPMKGNKMGKKYFKYIVVLICSMCLTFTIFMDKSADITTINELINIFHHDVGLIVGVVWGVFVYLGLRFWEQFKKSENKLMIFCLSILFSQLFWFGMRLDQFDSLINLDRSNILQWLIVTAGLIFLFVGLLTLFLKLINGEEITTTEIATSNKKIFVASAVICLIAWSIYFIAFYPGIVTQDSYSQINQALGYEVFSNHHPFMHTLLIRFIVVNIYKITHDLDIGIAVFTILQMIANALIVAYTQIILNKLKVKKFIRLTALSFYAFNPLVGVYVITMWKDISMGASLLLYLLLIIELLYLHNRTKKVFIGLFFAGLAVLFSKATGIAMIFLSLIGFIFIMIKDKKINIKFSVVIVSSIIVWVTVQTLAINVFGILPTEKGESMSIPLQQIARTVVHCDSELTAEEKETINEILPYDMIAESYQPRISDPIKSKFNERAYEENPGKYQKLWLELGKRYPIIYLSAFLNNTYGYWYPETDYQFTSPDSYDTVIRMYVKRGWEKWITNPNYKEYNISDEYFAARLNNYYRVNNLRQIPIIGILLSIGLYFWIYFVLFVRCFNQKDKRLFIPLSLVIGVFISCLVSPVHAEMRYAYPAMVLFPMILILSFKNLGENTNG